MKRIIHFSLANTKSGITQYVLNNWRYIDRTRFQFDVATFGGKLDFQEELEAEGCKVFYVKNRAERDLEEFRKEIREILSRGYDAVHLHTSYWKSFELEKLAKQAGIPRIIVHSHNTGIFDDSGREEKERQHFKLWEELTPEIATDFWACSRAASRWLYEDKIPKNRIHILNNAIDVEKFAFNPDIRQSYRERLKWEDKLIIGHIGRFSYQKNHEFLIQVFRETVKQNENIRLVLIGKGPLENRIYELAQQCGISHQVYFAGVCEDVNNWLQAMDILALPSRFEGLPIVAIEAQASGVFCILSEAITKETAITERTCFLPLEVSMWRDKILSGIAGIQSRESCADQVCRAGYDIRKQIKILENLYDGSGGVKDVAQHHSSLI